MLFQGAPFAPSPGTPMLTAVAGTAADGRAVLALLDEPLQQSPMMIVLGGGQVTPQASLCFDKPPSMSDDEAAAFPLLALRAAAALDRLGWRVSSGEQGRGSQQEDATVLVAGSAGRMPSLLVQLLAACGARPVVAARAKDAERLSRIGADRVIDHDCDDWAALLCDECSTTRVCTPSTRVSAVLDCVGDEEIPQFMEEQLGASYVSLAGPQLKALIEDGAFAAAANAFRRWREPEPPCVWAADAAAGDALKAMLSLVDEGALSAPALVDESAELADEYSEAMGWARDQDTGLRFGFPGKDLWAAAEGAGGGRIRQYAPRRPEESEESGGARDSPVWAVDRLKVMWDVKIDES